MSSKIILLENEKNSLETQLTEIKVLKKMRSTVFILTLHKALSLNLQYSLL